MKICLGFALFLITSGAFSQEITASESAAHAGEMATVCGTVSGIHQAIRSKGRPTFINLDKPYPNQDFTFMIWDSNLPAFGDLSRFSGKRLCALGIVKKYRGAPEMILNGPYDLKEKP